MLDIKYPILNKNLKLYCDSEINLSGIYYYLYDINNFIKCDIRLISPNSTLINYICWIDDDLTYKCLNRYCEDINIGKIINDTAQINLNIKDLIYKNNYFYDCALNPKIYINITANL
jgi:hypothetical protein